MAPPISRRTLLGVLGAAAALGSTARAQTYAPQNVPRIDRYRWAWARAQLVLEPGLTWLDTASFGPTLRARAGKQHIIIDHPGRDVRLGADRGRRALLTNSINRRYPTSNDPVCNPMAT